MTPQQVKPRKKVSTGVLVFAIVMLSPVMLIVAVWIYSQLAYLPLKAEIAHIADKDGIKPLSIECSPPGIDTTVHCIAMYDKLTYDQESQMLTHSGYTVEPTNIYTDDYINAKNSSTHIYAIGGSGYEGSGFEGKTAITFQYNSY